MHQIEEILYSNQAKIITQNKTSVEVNSIINKFEFISKITTEESQNISNWIKKENKIRRHMIEKTQEELFGESLNWNTTAFKINWEIWGFSGATRFDYNGISVYEIGSLIIWKQYRNLWLWKLLAMYHLKKFEQFPLYIVTNVDSIKHICKKNLWLKQIPKTVIPHNLLCIIGSFWDLLEDDEIYINEKLYFLISKLW